MTQEAQPSKESMEAAKKIADAQNDRGRNYDNGYSEDEIAAIIDASHSGLREELERAKQENLQLRLLVSHVDRWWDDDDSYESPEEYADACEMKIGEEFDLQAAQYWSEKFKVTKVPDSSDDNFEIEKIAGKRSEFPEYMAVKDRAETAESTVAQLEADNAALKKRLEGK